MSKINILKDPKIINAYLDIITQVGDANSNSIGFFPKDAYKDKINKGKVWVAIDKKDNYLGHLMFGGNSRELRVFQIYCAEDYRGKGVASSLINELTLHGEQRSCLNLRADVASDLTTAIRFYQGQGFCSLKPRAKKNSTGREVLIFQKRLATPSLLPPENLPLNVKPDLLTEAAENYVIDVNIFITLIQKRNNEELIAGIMKAAVAGEFNLFVTPEFNAELERNGSSDNPLLSLAKNALPVLNALSDDSLADLELEIRNLIFPTRKPNRNKSANDSSDIRHLAYCIKHRKPAFITEEKALLKARDMLHAKYGLSILSPMDFKVEHFGNIDPSSIAVPFQGSKDTVKLESNLNNNMLESFINSLGHKYKSTINLLYKQKTRGLLEKKGVLVNGRISAIYLAHTKGRKHDELEGIILTNSNDFQSREAVLEHLLDCFLKSAQQISANKVALHIKEDAFAIEKSCLKRGFQRAESNIDGTIRLNKVIAPSLITRSNWKSFKKSFLEQTNIQLPELIPSFPRGDDHPQLTATLNQRDYKYSLSCLETFISPSLILLPRRTGVIIPIRPAFASDLLAHDESFLPFPKNEEAFLRTEKVYFRKPTHKNLFADGMPIIFYESQNGRGAIGSARILSTEICNVDAALKTYRKYGVLDEKSLRDNADTNGNIHVIIFDNFQQFSNPVPLRLLKENGSAKANMVSPEKLSYQQLYNITHIGLNQQTKDVIISIQPNFVAKILSGKKTIELRKKPFPANGGVRIWVYTTKPISAIEAVAYVTEYEKGTPEEIWAKHKSKCGISKTDYDAYYDGCDEAYALTVSKAQKLSQKIKLEELKSMPDSFSPPQYFRYLEHNTPLHDLLLDTLM